MFEFVNGKVVIDPDLMAYPQFKAIWERDTSAEKAEAFAYFSYMFHYYHPKSSIYKGYPESVRAEEIKKVVFPEHMRNNALYDDKDFIQACNIFKEHLGLSSLRGILDFAKQTVHEITISLKSQKTKTGTKLNDLGKLNKVLAEIKETEKLIFEDEKDGRVKGARVVKDRERA